MLAAPPTAVPSTMRSLRLFAPSAVLLASTATAQAVLVVKPDGSGDFTTIQAAVDAAAPGDHVLVHGGLNANVVLDREYELPDDTAGEAAARAFVAGDQEQGGYLS